MLGKIARFLMVAWVVVFFTAALPLHQRGMVQTAGGTPEQRGATTASVSGSGGCPLCNLFDGAPTDPAKGGNPSDHCALCYLRGVLTTPPPVQATVPRLATVNWRLTLPIHRATGPLPPLRLMLGRAPPTT